MSVKWFTFYIFNLKGFGESPHFATLCRRIHSHGMLQSRGAHFWPPGPFILLSTPLACLQGLPVFWALRHQTNEEESPREFKHRLRSKSKGCTLIFISSFSRQMPWPPSFRCGAIYSTPSMASAQQ